MNALVYLVDRSHVQYAGNLSVNEQLRFVRQGIGHSGENPEYVVKTVEHMREAGIHDSKLEELVHQDDDVSAMLVKGMLKRLPVDFIHVKTFAEAQEQIQEADFDMVMLDLGLPDSYLSQTARDWFNLVKHTPTMIVTAHGEKDHVKAPDQPNVVGIMHKGDITGDGGLFETVVGNVISGNKSESIFARALGELDDMLTEVKGRVAGV